MTNPSQNRPSHTIKVPAALLAGPRLVKPRANSAARATRITALVAAAVVFVVMSAIFFPRLALYKLGHPVTATIVGREQHTSRHSTYYDINYVYEANGRQQTGDQEVDSDYWTAKAGDGNTVEIRRMSILGIETSALIGPGSHWWFTTWLILSFAILFSGIAVLIVYLILRKTARYRRILERGVAVVGQITDKTLRTAPRGGEFRHVKYNYRVTGGVTMHADMTVDRVFFAQAQIGQNIAVVYDPNDEKSSVIYEACGFEVVSPLAHHTAQ